VFTTAFELIGADDPFFIQGTKHFEKYLGGNFFFIKNGINHFFHAGEKIFVKNLGGFF
jgi:hypothetical protein